MSITDAAPSKYLTGVFESVHDELVVPELAVTGTIPAALSGAYLRNGSNPQFAPMGPYHWFDGDGMVHGIYLQDGSATYRNRWVDTPGLRHERARGKSLFGGLANIQFPEPELFAECGIFKNAANTNIVRHAGKVLALWEGGFPTELTWDLDTVGQWDMGGKLVGAFTAHPKWDDRTGELTFFGYDGQRPFLRYHVADRTGALVHSCEIEIPHGVMMHDFLTTEHYSLIWDFPAVIEIEHMMSGKSMWQPDYGARIGVLPRYGTNADVRWFEIDPCYVFHFMNAWEEGDRLVAVGCRIPSVDLNFEDTDGPDPMADNSGIGLYKWTIDLTAGTVREEQISSGFQEFPRVSDPLVGYPTRYGHLSATLDRATVGGFDAVMQYDLATGDRTVNKLRPGCITGEAVFAHDPSGTDERDGWVLTYEVDTATRATDLLILDGHDITNEVARVHLPRRVPPGFHGNWLPA